MTTKRNHLLASVMLISCGVSAAVKVSAGSFPLDSIVSVHSTGSMLHIFMYSQLIVEREFTRSPLEGIELKRYGPGEKERMISISVDNVTRREALDILVRKDPDYYWELSEGVLNILPKANTAAASSSPGLGTVLPAFDIDNAHLGEALHALVLQAQKQGVKLKEHQYPHDDPALAALPHFSIHFVNKSVRDCLNEIIRKDAETFWRARPDSDGIDIWIPAGGAGQIIDRVHKERQRQFDEQSTKESIDSLRKEGYRQLSNGVWVKDEPKPQTKSSTSPGQ